MDNTDNHDGIDRLFEPLRVGPMALRNRIMVPSHGAGIGPIIGTDLEAEQFRAYYVNRAKGGAGWVGGSNAFVRNPLPPGFEPTGVGASTAGTFRHSSFVSRYRRYMDELHENGAVGTVQMILQGGMPHGPSAGQATGWASSVTPHELEVDEILWLVEEYRTSAGLALEGGVDGVEVHANHDDVVHWFLSPLSNCREDDYGGSPEKRMRFLLEIVAAIRHATRSELAIGVRLCMDEFQEGGYGLEDARVMVRALTDSGNVDYLSLDVGNNWGAPSYIPPQVFGPARWASMCGDLKRSTTLPVVYAGLVTDPMVAADVLAHGHADVVAINRGTIADPRLPEKAKARRLDEIRPCVGVNDCINRLVVDRLTFGCAVNPAAGRELEPVAPASPVRKVLVVGGGPAGMETAAVAAERGHFVTLWEQSGALGGQMALAARTPIHRSFGRFIEFQERRLGRLGVDLRLGQEGTADEVVSFGADAVVLAVGAPPRRPDVAGVDLPFVHQLDDVLTGAARPTGRVVVVAQHDHMPPLVVADVLANELGAEVVLVHQSMAPAPEAGKYTVGAALSRILGASAEIITMHRCTGIEEGVVHFRDVFAGSERDITGVDAVVMACGRQPDPTLRRQLQGRVGELHVIGDAFAPRRITFATRQAWALAGQL
jgi:2,4-dienoyl-CoA reductase-like NADH-dependent reductase (Old Yellow Enzyme family)/thioredoxin reductase